MTCRPLCLLRAARSGIVFTLLLAVVIAGAQAAGYAGARRALLNSGKPGWLPAGAVFSADFTTEGAANHYWANGRVQGSEAAFLAALSGSFSRASTASYTNAGGLLASAASGVLRFDYGPLTLAAKGVLLEGARTNLLLQSDTLSSASWNVGASSVVKNAQGPDGAVSAWTMTAAAGSNTHVLFQSTTLNSGSTYAISAYVKAGTSRYMYLSLRGGVSDWIVAVFDLGAGPGLATQTGVGGGFDTIVSATVTSAPNGMLRVSLIGSINGTSTFPLIGIAPAATGNTISSVGQISFNASGTENIIIADAQLEAGSLSSSYIATTSGSATRAADALALTLPAGVGHIDYIFDDNSTQTVAVSPGAYTVPTTLARPNIKSMAGRS